MKKNIRISLLIFVLLSCKKEIVEIPDSNSPVFKVSGYIGEEQVNFTVGDDNSIFHCDSETLNSIKFFKGVLINNDTQIEIGIFNGQNESSKIDPNLFLSNPFFQLAHLPNNPVFEISKDDLMNNSNIKEVKWYLDGVYSGANKLTIYEPGKYNVCAKIFYFNQGYVEVCNEILVGFKRQNEVKLDFNFENNNLTCWVKSFNSPITSIKWFVDGKEFSDNIQLNTVLQSGLHTVAAEIYFLNGLKKTRKIIVDASNLNRSINDFAYFEKMSKFEWDYNLKFNFKSNNIEYTSLVSENETNKFTINSVVYLGEDKDKVPVYIFKGILNSKVKSKSTNEILDVNLSISWGLGLK
jgi:hypothetical protein